MRSYTTLGEGRSTKVLSVAPHHPARTVTTVDLPTAKRLCAALGRTDRCLPVELHGLAESLAGTPVEARRALLAFFDASLEGSPPSAGELWAPAERLVADVAAACDDAPAAVRSAVRAELADHLTGFDGVLVPARIVLDQHRAMTVDVVISGPLEWMGDQMWSYMLGSHGDLELVDDDPRFSLGAPLAHSLELTNLAQELYDASPASTDFTAFSVEELFDAADDDSGIAPEVLVRADHLLAWVAHHRPGDLERATAMLAAAD